MKKFMIVLTILGVLMMSVAAVSAQDDSSAGRSQRQNIRQIVLEITGLDAAAIREGASQGMTYGEIITAKGGDVEAIEAQLVETFSQYPNADPAKVAERVANLLNTVPGSNLPDRPNRRAFQIRNLVQTFSEVTGLDLAAIREGFQNGQSLADLITASDGDVDAVVQELTAKVMEAHPNLDSANVAARITEFLNKVPGENRPLRPNQASGDA